MDWSKLLYLAGALLLGWLLYRNIRKNPQAFSRENLNKSFFTLAILALILIVFLGVIVLLLRN